MDLQAKWIARLQHASVPPSERKLLAYGKAGPSSAAAADDEESFTFDIVSYHPLETVMPFPLRPPPLPSPLCGSQIPSPASKIIMSSPLHSRDTPTLLPPLLPLLGISAFKATEAFSTCFRILEVSNSVVATAPYGGVQGAGSFTAISGGGNGANAMRFWPTAPPSLPRAPLDESAQHQLEGSDFDGRGSRGAATPQV